MNFANQEICVKPLELPNFSDHTRKIMQQDIFSALGFSFHYDDCKGNFAQAQQLLDQWAATQPQPAYQVPSWQAVIHYLTGNMHGMEAALDEYEALSGNDVNQLLMVETYRSLLTHERYNTYLNGSGTGAIEISAHWRGARDLMEPDARWQQLKAQVTDTNTAFGAWYTYSILCTIRPTRYNADRTRYKSDDLQWREMVGGFIQQLLNLFQQSQQFQNYPFGAYVGWMAADLYHWVGELAQAKDTLAQARQSAVLGKDALQVLYCDMIALDWQCAHCGSPLSWNFAIHDSSSAASALIPETEQLEMGPIPESQLEQCRAGYEQLAQSADQQGFHRLLGNLHLRMAYIHAQKTDFATAEKYIHQAVFQFENTGDQKALHLAKTHLLLCKIGQNQTAGTEAMASAIGQWGQENGCLSFALSLGMLINRFARKLLMQHGDYEKSMTAYRSARALFQGFGARINAAQNRVDIGLILKAIGQHELAASQIGEALDEYQQILKDYPEKMHGGEDVVTNLRQRIIFLSADAYQLALREIDPDGMQRNVERIKVQLADIPDPTQNLESMMANITNQFANDDGHSGLSLMDLWPLWFLGQNIIEQASVLVPVYRARAARRKGDQQALGYHLRQAEKALNENNSAMHDFLAAMYWAEKEDWDTAAECYDRYLNGGQQKQGFTGVIGKLMQAMGNTSTEAELQDQRNWQQAFSMWVQLRQYEKARHAYQQLENRHGKDWWQGEEDPWLTLRDLAEIEENIGSSEKALTLYQEAIQLLESRRKTLSQDSLKTALSGNRGVKNLYLNAVRLAFKTEAYELAFQLTEESKARGLLDLMAGSLQHLSADSAQADHLRQWRQLNAQITLWQGMMAQEYASREPSETRIADYRQKITRDELALSQLENTLAQQQSGIRELASIEGQVLDAKKVAQQLNEKSLLVEYIYSSERLFIFGIDHSGLVFAFSQEIDDHELERQIEAFHGACRFGTATQEFAIPLSKVLIEPLAQLKKTYSKWFMVPYGKCHTLPIHALPWKGKLLGDAVQLAYLPSASTLQYLKAITLPERPNLLAIGNPTGDLKAAAVEAAWVAHLFEQKPLLGDEATEAQLRQQLDGADILHFATHGYLSEKNPLQSALAMEPGESLTLYELMGLNIKAQLAVLSACNTAQGETTGGDDVLGLSRGLLSTGVKAAVVTLWEVDDVATSLLMRYFYQQLKSGTDPAEALHEAQQYLRGLSPKEIDEALRQMGEGLRNASISKEVLTRSNRGSLDIDEVDDLGDDYSHPFYWAPFVLVGR